jgi:hypothetical protein
MLNILRKKLIAAAGLIAMSVGIAVPANAEMPVIDAANLTQAIHQVISWGQQLQGMEQQYNQLVYTYQSLTGPRGMQNVLPLTLTARNYLPPDYAELMSVMNGTSVTYALLAGQVQGTIQSNAVLNQRQVGGLSQRAQSILGLGRQDAATLSMLSRTTQSNASNNFGNVQGLIARVGSTTDTKASADLSGRIQSEQIATTTNQIKTEALYQAVNAREMTRDQQITEAAVASLGDFNTRYQPPMKW